MCECCVRTISDRLSVSVEEKTLILKIPHEESLNNRFPFSDLDTERGDCEVFFKGSQQACVSYLSSLPSSIQRFFVIDEVDSTSLNLI